MTERIKQLKIDFEKLETVSEIFNGLHPTIIWFSDTESKYATSFTGFDEKVNWLNGAWYVFQELNKPKKKKLKEPKKAYKKEKQVREDLRGWECAREAMFRPYEP